MLDVCLLGSGGMMPLPYRWLTALMLRYNGSSVLIDCGEGTQIAIKEKGWSFKPIDVICFTHYHGDHISGLPGLLLTMGNADRQEPLTLIGPKGLERVVTALRVIAPELPFEAGAMAEPLACCLHGIDAAGIRPGSTVCVIGGGAIGLLMVQLARLSGAAKVILSEPVELRRSAGLSVGADLAVDPLREDLSARVREAAGKSGADVVIECVGNTAATRSAFEAAGFGATVLLFSVPAPTATVPLPLFDVYKKELAIRGSFINPDTHLRAVELLSAGRINVEPLITHTFGIGEMEQAIKMQMGGESIKVMVLPNKR